MFIKYHSLVNDYNVDLNYVDLDTRVYVTEKLDGSNISLCVKPDGTHQWASRNKLVSNDWSGIDKVVPEEVIQKVVDFATEYDVQINLYGEIFSSKILKRIPYGSTKVRFYDVALDGNMKPSYCFYNAMEYMDIRDYAVDSIHHFTLERALNMDVEEFHSAYAPEMAEGIVIKPAFTTEFNSRVPAIKKKRKEFFEKRSTIKREVTTPFPQEYLGYLTENRVLDTISKHGEVTRSMIGDIIKETALDAIDDYVTNVYPLTEAERKAFYKYSGKILGPIVSKAIKV